MDKFLPEILPINNKPNDPQSRTSEIYGMYATVVGAAALVKKLASVPVNAFDQIFFYTDSLTAPTVFAEYVYLTDINQWKSKVLGGQKTLLATRAMNAVSGAVNYAHGLGRIPSGIEVIVHQLGTIVGGLIVPLGSHGFYDGTNTRTIYYSSDGTSALSSQDTSSVALIQGLTTGFQTAVATFDSTNVILTWTKDGSPDGDVADIIIKAY